MPIGKLITVAATAELLEWDSAFFGFAIGRIVAPQFTAETGDAVRRWAREHGVRCVYFLCPSTDAASARAAQQAGFAFADVRVVFSRSPRRFADRGLAAVDVRRWQPDDVPLLTAIARRAYTGTRFQQDPGFPRAQVDELYAVWVERSCGGYADDVFVATSEAGVEGFVTCHREDARGRVGLVGVAESARRRGVGRALLGRAVDWFADAGVDEIQVVTQGGNIGAQRLYQRCGFCSTAIDVWLHGWFD